MHKHNHHGKNTLYNNLVTHKFKIEDRRRQVAILLVQSITESKFAIVH